MTALLSFLPARAEWEAGWTAGWTGGVEIDLKSDQAGESPKVGMFAAWLPYLLLPAWLKPYGWEMRTRPHLPSHQALFVG